MLQLIFKFNVTYTGHTGCGNSTAFFVTPCIVCINVNKSSNPLQALTLTKLHDKVIHFLAYH